MQGLLQRGGDGILENTARGIALLEALVAADPDDRRARYLLTSAYESYVGILTNRNRQGEVLPCLQKALAMTRILLKEDPANADYRLMRAALFGDLGGEQRSRKDLESALGSMRQALGIYEDMLAVDPKNRQVRRNIATVLTEIGDMTLERKGARASMPSLQRALSLYESFAKPLNLPLRWGIVQCRYSLGMANLRLGNTAGASALFAQSRPEMKDMLDRGLLPMVDAQQATEALAEMARH
jgi:tetratricopeptide (TPR) repeat protein